MFSSTKRIASAARLRVAENSNFLKKSVALTLSYATTLVVVFVSIYLLRGYAADATTSAVLSFYFISALTAGIEPGQAKSEMIENRPGNGSAVTKVTISTAVIKAALCTPLVALLWWYTSGSSIPIFWNILLSFLAASSGFVTSEYRVHIDVSGRFTKAIWLKQGSLSIAMIGAVIFSLLQMSIVTTLLLASLLRIGWLILFSKGEVSSYILPDGSDLSVIDRLRSTGWLRLFLISLMAAMSGSIDRIVALRLLSPQDAATYILIFEFMSKIWLFPYILSPILFAQRIRTGNGRAAWQAVYINTGLLVGGGVIMGLSAIPVSSIYTYFGIDILVLFTLYAAFAVCSIVQLLFADVQASGHSRAILKLSFATLVFSLPLFFFFTHTQAMLGIAVAWLVKSVFELTATLCIVRWVRKQESARNDTVHQ